MLTEPSFHLMGKLFLSSTSEKILGVLYYLIVLLLNLHKCLCQGDYVPEIVIYTLNSSLSYLDEIHFYLMHWILIKTLSQVSQNANTNFGFIKSSRFSSKSDLNGELYHIEFLLCCHYN